jgi:hypothetical protein
MLTACAVLAAVAAVTSTTALAQQAATILKPADTQKILPPSVFYGGQTAPTQMRNSGGIKFADGSYVLATLVDTSGYSSGIVAKYQGYFIAEVPVKVSGQRLPAGAYGIGFIGNDKFVVTDIGAHDVLTVTSASDSGLKRPMPLQFRADPSGGFRLYAGRRYVVLSR